MSINIDSFRAIALNANLDRNAEIGVADEAKTKIGIQGAKPLALRAISVPNELERRQDSIYLRSQLLSAIRDALRGAEHADEIFKKAEAQLFGAVDGKTGRLGADFAAKPLTVRDVRAALDVVNEWDRNTSMAFTRYCEANPSVTVPPKWALELPVDQSRFQRQFNDFACSYAQDVLRHQGLRMTPENMPKVFEQARCLLETIKGFCGADRDLQEIVFRNFKALTLTAESRFRGLDVVEAKVAKFRAMLDFGRTCQGGIYLNAMKHFMIDSAKALDIEGIRDILKCSVGLIDAKMLKPNASMRTMHAGFAKYAKTMADENSPLHRAYLKYCPDHGGDDAGAFYHLATMLSVASFTPAQRAALHGNLKAHALPLRALYRKAQTKYELDIDLDLAKLGVFIGLNNAPDQLDEALKSCDETLEPSYDDKALDAKVDRLRRDEIDLSTKDLEELGVTNDGFFARRNG